MANKIDIDSLITEKNIEGLINALDYDDWQIKLKAIVALGDLSADQAVERLVLFLQSDDSDLKAAVEQSLEKINTIEAKEALEKAKIESQNKYYNIFITKKNPVNIRISALQYLYDSKYNDIKGLLEKYNNDTNIKIRNKATQLLSKINQPKIQTKITEDINKTKITKDINETNKLKSKIGKQCLKCKKIYYDTSQKKCPHCNRIITETVYIKRLYYERFAFIFTFVLPISIFINISAGFLVLIGFFALFFLGKMLFSESVFVFVAWGKNFIKYNKKKFYWSLYFYQFFVLFILGIILGIFALIRNC